MNKQTGFLSLKSFAALTICLLAFSGASAAATLSEQLTRSLVVSNLSARLKTDLAQTDVSVKLSSVKQQQVSDSEIAVKGSALAILASDNNRLPIQFEATIDTAQKSISGISYDFVEEAADSSAFAPAAGEEILMKTLMKQISRDYKTDNIVIALDSVEDKSNAGSARQFSGTAEVRIGDMEWNRIDFDVVIDANGKANRVIYDVRK